MSLEERLKAIAEGVVERERRHADDMAHAAAKLGELRTTVASAIDAFNAAVAKDVPQLSIDVSPVRLDEKHLHAHEFELARGRHRALVIAKSKSEFTLVGPFRTGKSEGPCRTFPFAAESDLEDALEDFLERFLEEATTP
ncbi:MAG: hypothetical protein NXI30_10185 [bacterium]|nr:hypothetical protein [bacterium]